MNIQKSTRMNIISQMEILMESNSYESITIQMITKKCNLSRQAFYKYFFSKEDLFRQMYLYYLSDDMIVHAPFTWRSMIKGFLSKINMHLIFYRAVIKNEETFLLFRTIFHATYTLYKNMIEERIRQTLSDDLDFLLQSYCRGGIQLLVKALYTDSILNEDKLCELFERSMPPEINELLMNFTYNKDIELSMPEYLSL